MGPDEAANQVQLSGAETMAASAPKRLQPELAGLVLPLHMNVRRLAAVEAGEEEAIRPRNASDSRHSKPLLPPGAQQAIAYLKQGLSENPPPPGAPPAPLSSLPSSPL